MPEFVMNNCKIQPNFDVAESGDYPGQVKKGNLAQEPRHQT